MTIPTSPAEAYFLRVQAAEPSSLPTDVPTHVQNYFSVCAVDLRKETAPRNREFYSVSSNTLCNMYKMLVRKPEVTIPLEWHRRTREDDITHDLKEVMTQDVGRSGLAQDKFRWWLLVEMVRNLKESQKRRGTHWPTERQSTSNETTDCNEGVCLHVTPLKSNGSYV